MDFRQLLHGHFGRRQQALNIHASALQQGARSVLLSQHGEQNVNRLNIGVVATECEGLSLAQGFLKFGGEFFDSHGYPFNFF
jgi:hypothetical protein